MYSHCGYWRDSGYCDQGNIYYNFMAQNCRASCGLCEGKKNNKCYNQNTRTKKFVSLFVTACIGDLHLVYDLGQLLLKYIKYVVTVNISLFYCVEAEPITGCFYFCGNILSIKPFL